jgi:predicted enzyme related to lactoylglutathione lyase
MEPKLGTVILYVRDLPGARRFYTEAVGLTVDERQSSPLFVGLQTAGGPMLALQDVATRAPGVEGQPGAAEVGLEVDDVDAVWHDWRAKGVRTLGEPSDKPFGRSFQAVDPEGHLLNVYRLAS